MHRSSSSRSMDTVDASTISQAYEDAFEAIHPADVAAVHRARAEALRSLRRCLLSLPGTQQQIAERLGLKQPRLNRLLRGEMSAISLDNIVKIAARAGLRVRVELLPGGADAA